MNQVDKPKLALCMTSDLAFDQRMQRIAKTLEDEFVVTIFHRPSGKLNTNNFTGREIPVSGVFKSGPLFYAAFNVRLFFLLLFHRFDLLYAVDTDTLAAVGLAKVITRKKAVYDSHEWFTEVPELMDRPWIKAIWKVIERLFVRRMDLCITVNSSLAKQFELLLKKPFLTIRNLPKRDNDCNIQNVPAKILMYQGAVNKGRGIECAIAAMQFLPDFVFHVYGNGDLKNELEVFTAQLEWGHRIKFFGALSPEELKCVTPKAMFGLNLLDGSSLSYKYSLANKFFDYLQAGVPSINMNFPEYRAILEVYQVGLLLEDLDPQKLARLIDEQIAVYGHLKNECIKHRNHFVWDNEELKLLEAIRSLMEGKIV